MKINTKARDQRPLTAILTILIPFLIAAHTSYPSIAASSDRKQFRVQGHAELRRDRSTVRTQSFDFTVLGDKWALTLTDDPNDPPGHMLFDGQHQYVLSEEPRPNSPELSAAANTYPYPVHGNGLHVSIWFAFCTHVWHKTIDAPFLNPPSMQRPPVQTNLIASVQRAKGRLSQLELRFPHKNNTYLVDRIIFKTWTNFKGITIPEHVVRKNYSQLGSTLPHGLKILPPSSQTRFTQPSEIHVITVTNILPASGALVKRARFSDKALKVNDQRFAKDAPPLRYKSDDGFPSTDDVKTDPRLKSDLATLQHHASSTPVWATVAVVLLISFSLGALLIRLNKKHKLNK